MTDVTLRWLRDRIECFGVNQVAAGILEDSFCEVELAKRTAFRITCPLRRKLMGKIGIAHGGIISVPLTALSRLREHGGPTGSPHRQIHQRVLATYTSPPPNVPLKIATGSSAVLK